MDWRLWEELRRRQDGNLLALTATAMFAEQLPIHQEYQSAAAQYGTTYPVEQLGEGWVTAMVLEAVVSSSNETLDAGHVLSSLNKLDVDPRGLRAAASPSRPTIISVRRAVTRSTAGTRRPSRSLLSAIGTRSHRASTRLTRHQCSSSSNVPSGPGKHVRCWQLATCSSIEAAVCSTWRMAS